MNNVLVDSTDPFLSRRNTQVMSDEIMQISGSKVVVRPYILPHISDLTSDEIATLGGKDGLRKSQGFYVYRNKRLLVWGTWFRMMKQTDFSKLARVQVDIPNELDSLWTLDIKKSRAIPPEEIRNNLDTVIERLAEYSKRTWEFRGKKETHDSIVHVWQRFKGRQGGLYYTINRDHPLVEVFEDLPQQIKRNVENLLKAIEDGLPLNSLYMDLNSDKMVENEIEIPAQAVEILLQDLLAQFPADTAKAELLDRLAVTEPFVHYPHIIRKYESGGTIHVQNEY